VTGPRDVISTILKHDEKVTSYKIALLRAINDVVLSFPDMRSHGKDIAVPLRVLAEFWVAYYWPFVDPLRPIMQGTQSVRGGGLSNDMAFRPSLTQVRAEWERSLGGVSRPSDGFFLINELRISRKRALFSDDFLKAYHRAREAICQALLMPICHAGPGQWTVFDSPAPYASRRQWAVPIPGTQDNDKCLLIRAELWQAFRELSLWVEALCIHEWCLFTEKKAKKINAAVDRGLAYCLLTDRPDNRRPLSWERNQVDLLMMEGMEFVCPWTERPVCSGMAYDLDHLVPVSVYPINELWNLVPSDPSFNMHIKRDRLPSPERLVRAEPHLVLAYTNYGASVLMSDAIREDVAARFSTIRPDLSFPHAVARAAVDFISEVAASRNLARFS
jgi:hypothetical protein